LTQTPERRRSSRRAFLAAAAAAGAIYDGKAQPVAIPILDTHIHLFDTARPQGVPWPPKDNAALYTPALPERLRGIAGPLGVVGAIAVEASPWLEDNLWLLETAQRDTLMVGVVGNLDLTKPDFFEYLERFRRHPLFLGIRYGNLWGRNLAASAGKPEVVSALKALADAGLTLDTANQRPDLIDAVVRLTDRVPNLRVVIDHLPQMEPPADPAARRAHEANLRELAARPAVYVKISEVVRRVDGRVPLDLDFYRPRLDQLSEIFGEDRLLFGSDWPNSDNWVPYQEGLKLVRAYFEAKGNAAAEKYFWKNSIAAYRWVKREPNQPVL
jgi:L-fuconolactonase